MIDLNVLPAKLPPIHTQQGRVTVERLQNHHADILAEAGKESADTVHPWLGKALCPVSLRTAQQTITQLEEKRAQGYGICYLMCFKGKCLGLGIINYIHPLHGNANLGYWLRPTACGQGLASALCNTLKRLAFLQMDLIRLELLIEPDNYLSIALAKRLKATQEGLCKKRIFGRDALLFSLTG